MHSQELKILAVISMFCLMALSCLAVASFLYTHTQHNLIQQAAVTGQVSQQYAKKHEAHQYVPAGPIIIRGVIA